MKKTILILTASALVSACAHRPPPPAEEDIFFETKINHDGTKLFAFSLQLLPHKESKRDGFKNGQGKPDQSVRKDHNAEGPSAKGARTSPHHGNERFYAALDNKLEQTAYCRTGYIEIDTHQTEGRLHLLGECKETATELDRTNFPNPH